MFKEKGRYMAPRVLIKDAKGNSSQFKAGVGESGFKNVTSFPTYSLELNIALAISVSIFSFLAA